MTTERAKRAAAVLVARGWSIDEAMHKNCASCNAELRSSDRYCWQCGTKMPPEFSDGSLDDIEAALVAAGETQS